ncbi:MAG TPA: transferrin-binding protein-like solute binding protein [Micropepsaceae bacterium]|nr:transferrin-binding protein-like solute binding protein [Micropepsaceae bacterium]
MRTNRICAVSLLVNVLALGACAGGHYTVQVNPAAAAAIPAMLAIPNDPDTGSVGPIAAPAAAVWGNAPAQIATPSGPAITTQPPVNTTFPVLAAGLQFTVFGGVSAITGGATATVTGSGPGDFSDDVTYARLFIPAANMSTLLEFPIPASPRLNPDGTLSGLNYLDWGLWGDIGGGNPLVGGTAGAYVVGYEAPLSTIPSSGQASFAGNAFGSVFASFDGHVKSVTVYGNASLSVDFASGAVIGALTAMAAGGAPWNDVSLSATIAAGSTRFSGSTGVTAAPANPFALGASATGHIDGAFFGPTAQTIGAVWTLSDGTAAAVGALSVSR